MFVEARREVARLCNEGPEHLEDVRLLLTLSIHSILVFNFSHFSKVTTPIFTSSHIDCLGI